MLFVTGFCIRLNDSFRGIRHLRNPMALIKTGPFFTIYSIKLSQNFDLGLSYFVCNLDKFSHRFYVLCYKKVTKA